jgi:hypothetical protein
MGPEGLPPPPTPDSIAPRPATKPRIDLPLEPSVASTASRSPPPVAAQIAPPAVAPAAAAVAAHFSLDVSLDAAPSAPGPERSDAGPIERWRAVIAPLRQADAKLGAFLDHAEVVSADDRAIHIRYPSGSLVEMALKEPGIALRIEQAAEALFGVRPAFQAEVAEGNRANNSVFEVDKQARQVEQKEAILQAKNHPYVQEAVRVLGARIKNIELAKN